MSSISATELARHLGDVLSRVRYRRESFVIERNRRAVARLGPLSDPGATSVKEVLEAWCKTGGPDPEFAEDLARVNRADQPPRNPWASSSTPARSSR